MKLLQLRPLLSMANSEEMIYFIMDKQVHNVFLQTSYTHTPNTLDYKTASSRKKDHLECCAHWGLWTVRIN